jgi:hypothetical protein
MASPSSKVLSVGNEFRLYTTARIFSVGGSLRTYADAATADAGPQLSERLLARGYKFLIVNESPVRGNPGLSRLPVLDPRFRASFCSLEFVRRNVYLYRLKDPKSAAAGTACEDLLQNPGFEEQLAPGAVAAWFRVRAPAVDSTGKHAHTGVTAVKVDHRNGLFQRVAVQPDVVYTIGQWSRADRPKQFVRLQVNWLDAERKRTDVSIKVAAVSADWSWYQMSMTSPRAAAFADVYASVHENSEVWLDDIRFVRNTIEDPNKPCPAP